MTSVLEESELIVDAMRQLHSDDQLAAAMKAEPDAVLDRLGLSGVARQAVTAGCDTKRLPRLGHWW